MSLPPHGGQLPLLARSLGVSLPQNILDFSANINPDGPPPSVRAALRAALQDPATLTTYPDLELLTLRTAIAHHTGRTANQITVANGFVPLLEATLRARNIRRCLLPVPAFSEYRATLERIGATVVPYPLPPPAFPCQPELLLKALRQHQADAILLANPQNPSGRLTPAAELLNLFHAIPPTTTILLDEAFIDYTPTQSLATATLPNLILFRSVTKFYAMPAMRIAYAIASHALSSSIQAQLPPWPVSRLAEIATIAALVDTTYAQIAITQNARRSQALQAALTSLGVIVHPSSANFLLLRTPMPAHHVWQALLFKHGLSLRLCENYEALDPHYLRTAIRTEAENDRLVTALTAVLRDQSASIK